MRMTAKAKMVHHQQTSRVGFMAPFVCRSGGSISKRLRTIIVAAMVVVDGLGRPQDEGEGSLVKQGIMEL